MQFTRIPYGLTNAPEDEKGLRPMGEGRASLGTANARTGTMTGTLPPNATTTATLRGSVANLSGRPSIALAGSGKSRDRQRDQRYPLGTTKATHTIRQENEQPH